MTTKNLLALSLSLCLALSLAACGEEEGEEPFECTAANSLCWVISVPADFAATPVNLYVTGYDAFPPAGMPNAMFNALPSPAIGPGQPLEFMAPDYGQFGFSGEKYLAIALLVEGGGAMSPVEGVDWIGYMTTPVNFDGGAKNLPPVTLAVFDDPATN